MQDVFVVDPSKTLLKMCVAVERLVLLRDVRVVGMVLRMSPFMVFILSGKGGREMGKEAEYYIRILGEESSEEKKEFIRWRAPEVSVGEEEEIKKKAENGRMQQDDWKKVEGWAVFSFGLMFFEMMTGEIPLSDVGAMEAHSCVCEGERPETEGVGNQREILLLRKMWRRDWKKRPELRSVIQDLKQMIGF
jgi:hypothetical protein